MDVFYPCIYGCVSLNKNNPGTPPAGNPSDRIFSDDRAGVTIYRRGMSKDIHVESSENHLNLVVGRVYNPVYIDSESTITSQDHCQLKRTLPQDIEGHYLSIRYEYSDSDGSSNFNLNTDKYGSKIVLHYCENGMFYFATHISGLTTLLGDKVKTISRPALLHVYHFGIAPADQFLLQNIKKLPAASVLNIRDSKLTIQKYFHLAELYEPLNYATLSETAVIEQLNQIMTNSMFEFNPRKRTMGVAISGGVDSGFIAKKLIDSGSDIAAYNIGYGEEGYNEFDRINVLEKQLKIDVKRINLTVSEILESFEFGNSIGNEPIGFNDAAMRLLAIDARKDGIESVMDGDGADRLFLGMNSHMKYYRILGYYSKLKSLGLLGPAVKVLKHMKNTEMKKLSAVFENWYRGIPPYVERKYKGINSYNAELEREVFDLGIRDYWEDFSATFNSDDIMLYFTYQSINMCPEIFFHSPAEQQLFLGLTPIPAYWSSPLVSLAFSIPTSLKIKNGKTKYILRRAAAAGDANMDYWMLPKIGLQSAFKFVKQSKSGQVWCDEICKRIRQSQEYKIINNHLEVDGGSEVDVERLVPYFSWKESNSFEVDDVVSET